MDEKVLMAAAIERYGEGAQLVKCCEELAELQQAICKRFDMGAEFSFDVESVVEEIADVEIMLDQVRMILAVDPAQEARWRDRKLRRLKARLAR
jgi:hypothetical protein